MLRSVSDVPATGERAAIRWSSRTCARGVALALALGVAGCSADLGRFDLTSTGSAPTRTAKAPVPSESVRRYAGASDVVPENDLATSRPGSMAPLSQRDQSVRMSGLPEPGARSDSLPPAFQPPAAPSATRPTGVAASAERRPALPPTPTTASPAPSASAGQMIEVQPGDTLYGLSKTHRVSISELMTLNNLPGPNLKPGQKLALPAGRRTPRAPLRVAAAPSPTTDAPVGLAGPASAPNLRGPAPSSAASTPPDWAGTHTVASGESLYGIARRYRVKVAELQAVNGINDPRKVMPGSALKVPGSAVTDATATGPGAAAAPAPAAIVRAPAADRTAPIPRPTIINAQGQSERGLEEGADAAQTRVASAEPLAVTAEQPAAVPTGRFRWPVKGKVISGFGPRPGAPHNDGINIAVPAGTDVAAAEAGVVAYAGSELKGYGNLVLVRHENNWVSAYAHNQQLLVKRGDKVRRGQVIAKAGATGTVDRPQVHFELRQGSKPVDPMPYLEKN
jgi:murein DD-endopeptidase MepM/ murein hydrolase activator NlpD